MDKKRMTADSVDELLEIVRAVQKGEDPDIDKIREEQRRKREEQILERRRKRSGGSADSAGPARASQKRPKEEQKREKDKKEGQDQEEKSRRPDEPEPLPGESQEDKTAEEESESVLNEFSWPQFDPIKMRREKEAEKGEDKEPAKDGGTETQGSEDTPEKEKSENESEEETEDERRREIFRPRLRALLGIGSADEDDSDEEEQEPDEDDSDEEDSDDEDSGGEEDESGERPRGKESGEDEEDFDDDEFERMLDDDNVEEEFIKSKETMTALTSKAVKVFGGLLQKAGDAAARGRERAEKKEEGFEEFSEDMFPDREPEAKSARTRPEKERTVNPEAEKESIRRLERSLSIRRRKEEPDDDFAYEKGSENHEDHEKEERPVSSGTETSRSGRPAGNEPDVRGENHFLKPEEQRRVESSSRSREQRRAESSSEPGEQKRAEKGSEASPGSERRRRGTASGKTQGKRTRRSRGSSPGPQKGEGFRRLAGNISDLLRAVRDRILDGWHSLNQRGIHKREMAMLGIVLLFILLILFFLVAAVRNFFAQKQKSRNVTAEDGLIVTVEDEPQDWTSSYPVQLKILCKKGSVSSVTINGVSCTPDENGLITLETGDWNLQARVETDDGAKTAQIEIPMLDGEVPSLDIEREGNTIVLSAADSRSQVEGIYYSIEDPGKYQNLPVYEKYQEPLAYEKGMTYRFYARDNAGNISTPVVSTLEDAESFTLGRTQMSLFPGETCSLSVEASPKGALLRNLKFESLDTAVVTVEDNGKVTAVGEGTAEIRVSADGMESQTCTFDVGTERSVLVSTIGDCTLGTDESFDTSTSFNAFDAVNGHDYFFRNVKDILGNDDVTFANFEGTLTDSTAREAKQFAFKGDPSYTEVLKDGSVEVVTLANNHSKDYGEQSLEDTKQALREAGIDYCIGDEIVMREVNGVQMAFIGIYVLDIGMEVQSQVVQTITQARQLGAELVIVAFHWGSEKATSPDETQRSLAHTAIDQGADLVVGHHPHVLQGIEQYKGKYIVYSLANFCFGGNSSPSDKDTMIFQQSFKVGQDGTVENGEISIIPCSISSESGYNNYQPTPATGSEAERIMGRLNEYSKEFGQTYSLGQ